MFRIPSMSKGRMPFPSRSRRAASGSASKMAWTRNRLPFILTTTSPASTARGEMPSSLATASGIITGVSAPSAASWAPAAGVAFGNQPRFVTKRTSRRSGSSADNWRIESHATFRAAADGSAPPAPPASNTTLTSGLYTSRSQVCTPTNRPRETTAKRSP